MKFKYRLEKVLQHRQTLEDIAQREFQQVQSQLVQEQERLQEQKNLLQKAYLQRGEIQDNSENFPPETLKQIHEFTILQSKVIENQNRVIEVIAKVVEEKRLILVEKVRETKALQKLKDKKFEEFNDEIKQKEQAENDELSILRFNPET